MMRRHHDKSNRSRRSPHPVSSVLVGALMVLAAFFAAVYVPAAGAALGTLFHSGVLPASTGTPAGTLSPYVTDATVVDHEDSLQLGSPGKLNIFAMANGAGNPSTGFSTGNLVTAIAWSGYPVAAIAATSAVSDHYTTSDLSYCIGGVGVSGFEFDREKTEVLIPPVPTDSSTLSEQLVLPASALVVVVALSGGHDNTIALGGIPGLVIDANGTGSWTCAMIGQAQLRSGTYTVTETETLLGTKGPSGGDLLGIFAFWNSVNRSFSRPTSF